MLRPQLSIALIAAALVGCQAGNRQNTPASPATPTTPSKADEFFPNPKDAALARALENNDWAAAEKALHLGADLSAIGKDKITLPAWAMYIKNKSAFEWLFNHGADPNLDPGDERCPLFFAAVADDPDWLRIMLQHKANPNLTYINGIGDVETPLMATALPRRLTNLKMLIAAGANVNYQTPNRSPAIIDAAMFGWFEGVCALLDAGADYQTITLGGNNLAYMVVRRNLSNDLKDPFREKALQLLRQHGADIEGAVEKVRDEEARDRLENPWRYHDDK